MEIRFLPVDVASQAVLQTNLEEVFSLRFQRTQHGFQGSHTKLLDHPCVSSSRNKGDDLQHAVSNKARSRWLVHISYNLTRAYRTRKMVNLPNKKLKSTFQHKAMAQ